MTNKELIAALEAADGPSRELEHIIHASMEKDFKRIAALKAGGEG